MTLYTYNYIVSEDKEVQGQVKVLKQYTMKKN